MPRPPRENVRHRQEGKWQKRSNRELENLNAGSKRTPRLAPPDAPLTAQERAPSPALRPQTPRRPRAPVTHSPPGALTSPCVDVGPRPGGGSFGSARTLAGSAARRVGAAAPGVWRPRGSRPVAVCAAPALRFTPLKRLLFYLLIFFRCSNKSHYGDPETL